MNTSEKIIPLEKKLPWYRSKLFRGLAVFLAVVIWFGLFAWYDVDLHHDGILLAAADLLTKQKVIFRDVFCQYGALTVWIQSIPVKFFGADVLVIRLTTVLFYGFVALLGAKIWGRFLAPPFKWIWYICFFTLCPFYLMSFHPWTSVYALFFMLLGVEMQLRFLEEDTAMQHPAVWAGVCAFAAFLCRTPCGIVTFAAGGGLFLLHGLVENSPRKFRGLVSYLGGAGAAALLYAAYLTVAGAWEDYVIQCFSFASKYATNATFKGYLQNLGSTIFPASDPWGVCTCIFLLFPLLTAGTLLLEAKSFLKWEREKIKKSLPLLAILFLTAASLHQYFPAPCLRHLWWAAIPAFGVYALAVQGVWHWKISVRWRILLVGILLIPLLTAAFERALHVKSTVKKIPQMVVADLPGIRHSLMLKRDYEFIKGCYSAYTSLPSELRKRGVLNHTIDGGFSLLFPPPPKFHHPMFVNWFDAVYPEFSTVASGYVEQEKPIIISTMVEKIMGYRLIFYGWRFDRRICMFAPLE